jgi:hypothetical protein
MSLNSCISLILDNGGMFMTKGSAIVKSYWMAIEGVGDNDCLKIQHSEKSNVYCCSSLRVSPMLNLLQ